VGSRGQIQIWEAGRESRVGKQVTEAGDRSMGGKQGADPEMGSRERIQGREAGDISRR
jgi:hypothetical protein